jgi:hypothetical protein
MFDEIQSYEERNRGQSIQIHHADVRRAIELVLSSEKAMSYIYNVAAAELLETDEALLLIRGFRGRGSEARSEQEKWEGIMDSTRIREDVEFRPSLPGLRDTISRRAL